MTCASTVSVVDSRALIPERLAHYRVLHLLGRGGMGDVYLAEDSRLDRTVALKVLAGSAAPDPERRQRFEREAKTVAVLNHPNIVTLHSVEEDQGVVFLTMEYVQGKTLAELIEPGGMSLRQLLNLAIPLADAVGAAHQRGITHRDLKPANVMVTTDQRVKVLDFGLAKLHGTTGALEETATRGDTGEGRIIGTVAYMAPEQAEGRLVDQRSDVFSLGTVLFEMITGQRPFVGDTTVSVLSAIIKDAPKSVTDLRTDLPRDLAKIVRRCLQKNPDERYQSAKDLRNDLKDLHEELTSGELAAATTERGQQSSAKDSVQPSLRHRVTPALMASAVLLAAIVVAWRVDLSRPASAPSTSHAKFQQLTANVSELPISTVMISADGRYLAYADPGGINVRIIDTGETQRLPRTKGMNLYGWNSDSTRVRASECKNNTCVGWSISLVGDSRYPTDGSWAAGEVVIGLLNAPGLLMLQSGPGSVLRYDRLDGSPARVLATGVTQFSPSPGNARALFTTDGGTLQSIELEGGAPTMLWRAEPGWRILDFVDLPQQRIIVSVSSSAGSALYELQADPSGDAKHALRPLTDWRPETIWWTTASVDGRRVVFLRTTDQTDVYVGEMDVRGTSLTPPKRLTLDERNDMVSAWTPDSKSVLFTSERSGNNDILRQQVGEETPEPAVLGPGQQFLARVTGDGQWLLYHETLSDGAVRLMRAPISGGVGQVVSPITAGGFVQCAVRGPCILPEVGASETTFYSLDPIRGKGVQLATLPGNVGTFAPLADGQGVVFVVPDRGKQNVLRVKSFGGGPSHDVVVSKATVLSSLDALHDGSGFLSVNIHPNGRELLVVRLNGSSKSLWSSPNGLEIQWGIPSPDGRRVAISAAVAGSNAWMMTDF